jgi:glycosyltransferase involved in cell wall biosynthesis
MADCPLVSAIIAVKNGERFLASAIESILQQGYQPLELIVVDQQSADRTSGIARSYEAVRYVWQAGQGVARTWNLGIDTTVGEFFAFLAADDMWTPDKLSAQMTYMLAHPEVDYTIARARFVLEPGCPIPSGFRMALLTGDHVCRTMETLVARKSLFERIGKLDPSFHVSEDVEWFVRANDHGVPHAVIHKMLLIVRIHGTNMGLNAPAAQRSLLLKALRQSIERKRTQRQGGLCPPPS